MTPGRHRSSDARRARLAKAVDREIRDALRVDAVEADAEDLRADLARHSIRGALRLDALDAHVEDLRTEVRRLRDDQRRATETIDEQATRITSLEAAAEEAWRREGWLRAALVEILGAHEIEASALILGDLKPPSGRVLGGPL